MKKSIFLFFAAFLCANSVWGATNTTLYFCPNMMWDGWTISEKIKVQVNRKGDGYDWKDYEMTSTGKTYHGYIVYSATFTDLYNGLGAIQFHSDNWGRKTQPFGEKTWTGPTTYNNKIWTGSWKTMTYDTQTPVKIYYACENTENYTVKINVKISKEYNSWETVEMTKTDKTYLGTPIYEGTFTDYQNGAHTLQLQRYNGKDWKDQLVPINNSWTAKNTYANKLYTGSEWVDYAYDVTITPTADASMGTISPSTPQTILNTDTKQFTANPNDNYEFVNWTHSDGVVVANSASANTNVTATKSGTLTANFRSTAVNALLVVAGENITSVTGSAEPVTLGKSYPISATVPTGYKFHQWTADPVENATFTDAASAATDVTVLNRSVTVTASATEIMSALTTSNTYNEGNPTIAAPTTSKSEIGIATTATITAATDIDYTLASWTLENCVRTDGGAENATTITVKSNGNGAAATVTANYNIIPKITLYFVNSTQWEVVACHHWKEGVSGTTWPGDLMEKVGTVYGFDIYKVKFTELEHDQCIFNNNNNGKQTGNLAVQDGKYYYPETDEWYATVAEIPTPCTDCSDYAIAGSMNDWSARRNRLKVTANNDIVELTLELTAGDYKFKIAGPEGWFGNSGKYEREHSGNAWTYRIKDGDNNDEADARIYIDMTGEYTFTWKISTKELTITYPELPDFSQQTNTILFRPSTDWKKSDARFAAYFFGATAENWVNMTDADGDGIYEATNPKTNLSVKICRLDPDKAENNWENVWNGSTNYEIPTGVENCWVVNDGEWDGATGIWTVLVGESDNSTTLSAANSQTVNTLVNRQFESDKLYTISLPFALDAEQVEDIFGAGTTLYQFAQLVKENEELVLYFSTPSAIAAATPYLIQPTQDVAAGFTVEDATISTTPNNISFTVDATTITMKPILSATAGEKTNGTTEYWLAADTWLYNNANTVLSLRALFNISTVSGMPPRCRVALGENAETGVDNIINGENTTIKVIENGQLIIIRNGEKFNAQGVRF